MSSTAFAQELVTQSTAVHISLGSASSSKKGPGNRIVYTLDLRVHVHIQYDIHGPRVTFYFVPRLRPL